MATWRPNERLYGPGGGEYVDDAGNIWPDPFGTLSTPTQAAGPVPGANAGAPVQGTQGGGSFMGLPGPAQIGGASPVASSNPAAEIATDRSLPAFADDATQKQYAAGKAPPPPTPGVADKAPPLPPPPTPGAADAPPAPAFVQVSESKDTTSGLDKGSAARTEAGINRQQTAQARADEGAVSQKALEAKLTEQSAAGKLASAAAGFADVAAKQAVQDHIAEEVDRRLNAGGPNSPDSAEPGSAYWRPDRAELFHGDHGVMFGISAAVAAMAGAWMQGRGLTGSNPYLPTIMHMIDENVDQQVRQNSAVFQHLKDVKGDVRAAKLELKERQLTYVQQQADGMALKDKSEILQAGLATFKDSLIAEREKTRNEQEKALNQTVTHETNRVMKANPAAKAAQLPRSLQLRYVTNNQIQEQYRNARAAIVEAQQNGAAEAYLGTVATHGVSWVQEHLNGLPPEQQKFAQTLSELRVINHLRNNIPGIEAEEKSELGHIGIPTKARDLSNTLGHFDEIYRMTQKENEQMLKGAGREEAGGEPDEDMPVGSY